MKNIQKILVVDEAGNVVPTDISFLIKLMNEQVEGLRNHFSDQLKKIKEDNAKTIMRIEARYKK